MPPEQVIHTAEYEEVETTTSQFRCIILNQITRNKRALGKLGADYDIVLDIGCQASRKQICLHLPDCEIWVLIVSPSSSDTCLYILP